MRHPAIILFLLVLINIHSVSGTYSVVPRSQFVGPVDDATGADAHVLFFELPLWIQISCIIGTVCAFFSGIKFGPIILGRIRDVLKNRNRGLVFEYIDLHPGCTIADLSANVHINRGTVKYHIYMLMLERKIVQKKDGNKVYLFKNSGNFQEKKQIFGYIRNPAKQKILFTILKEPGISNSVIAERLHLDKSSIYRHLQQFLDEKMVECHWNGKNMCYEVTPEVSKILNNFSSYDERGN
jgi:predicted transcriptional regulator